MRDSPMQFMRSTWFHHVTALLLVAITTAARWSLGDMLTDRAVFLIYLPAVALSAYLGGFWPGIVATLLSAIAAHSIILPMVVNTQRSTDAELLQLTVFVVTGAFVSALTQALRRSWRERAGVLDELRQMVAARDRADQRYRSFIQQSSEGIWRFELKQPVRVDLPEDEQIDMLFRHAVLAECNDAMARMYGYARCEQIIGKRLSELLVRDDARNVANLRSFLRSGHRLDNSESHELDCNGQSRFFLNNLVGAIEDGRIVRIWGMQRDVTEQKRAEARLMAEHAVTRILADAPSLEDAGPAILQSIRDCLRTAVGAMWLLDERERVLRCAFVNSSDADPRLGEFAQRSRAYTFGRGVGLPGRVWESRAPAWIVDLANDHNFPRAAIAAEAGIYSGMAFPITCGEELFGAVEFFTDRPVEPDHALLGMMSAIGSEIGQFISRRRAEEHLRRSQRELADFVENATIGLHWVGPHGKIIWANKAELELLGYSREEYVGHDIAEFHVDRSAIEELLRTLSNGQTLHDYPARLKCRDGSIKHVLIDSNVLFEDGKFVRTRCFTRDVTEQKRAEEALRGSEQSLRLALEAGRMGSWEWDVGSGRVQWSSGLEAIHGLAPGSFAGTFDAFLQDVHPEDRQQVLDEISRTLGARKDHHIEYRLHLSDGAVRWVEGRGKLFCDSDGNPQRMVGVCMDITTRKQADAERNDLLEREQRARAEAERANRAKDRFLAVLSHELRTPLTPVLLTVTLLENSPNLPLELQHELATIRRNVELEARLIDDLLDLTRISRGKLQLDLQTSDLHLLVQSAIDICHRTDEIKLVTDLTAPRHMVRGDPARLQQVFWNLLNNAHKFTPAGGTITVRSRNTPDGRIRVEVSDTGVGIDPVLLPRIFDAFEQGHDRSRLGGLGLGLAISKALVDQQNGALRVHSDGHHRGATFTVELPTIRAAAPIARTPSDDGHEPSVLRSLRILIVEDHEPTRHVMSRLLSEMGHETVSADGLESALDLVKRNRIDLVISDLGLPDGSGHELMRQLRQLYDVRGIALSGYGMDDDLRRSAEAGFCEHLTKPVDVARLEAAIRRAIDQHAVA